MKINVTSAEAAEFLSEEFGYDPRDIGIIEEGSVIEHAKRIINPHAIQRLIDRYGLKNYMEARKLFKKLQSRALEGRGLLYSVSTSGDNRHLYVLIYKKVRYYYVFDQESNAIITFVTPAMAARTKDYRLSKSLIPMETDLSNLSPTMLVC